MIGYCRTVAAEAFSQEGFRDHSGIFGISAVELTGVWIGNTLHDPGGGAPGDEGFEVDIDEPHLEPHEVKDLNGEQ